MISFKSFCFGYGMTELCKGLRYEMFGKQLTHSALEISSMQRVSRRLLIFILVRQYDRPIHSEERAMAVDYAFVKCDMR